MMAYAQAETSNKIMFSITVAVLFAIRIYSNSVHLSFVWLFSSWIVFSCACFHLYQ